MIGRYASSDNLINKPSQVIVDYRKIRKALVKIDGPDSTEMREEIADITKLPFETVTNVLEAYRMCKNVASLVEGYHDKSDAGSEGQADRGELKEDILEVMEEFLSSREIEVLKGRFGLNEDHKVSTLDKLAKRFHKTRERIRQIEEKALGKLRKPEARRHLEPWVA